MSDNLPKKILIVDTDRSAINGASNILASYSINVLSAADFSSALYLFNQNRFDLAIIAIKLEDLPGTALVQKWRNHEMLDKRITPFVLAISQQTTAKEEALITELGDISTIEKPFKLGPLLTAMANAIKRKNQAAHLAHIEEEVIEPELKKGNKEAAADIAKKQLETLNEKGLFKSALVHERADQEDRAIQLLTALSNKNPSNMSYINELGRIHLKNGNTEEAKKAYEKADSVAPMNVDRVKDMAYMYLQSKDPELSIEKFKEMIKLNPEKEDLKFEAYNAIFDAGFASHAQDFCKDTSTPKELIRHFNNKGVLLAKEEDYDSAIKSYESAAKLIPGNKELYRILYNLALSRINKKTPEDIEKAHQALEESIKLQPDFEKAKEKLKITAKYLKKDS